jgi:hypothetical protein
MSFEGRFRAFASDLLAAAILSQIPSFLRETRSASRMPSKRAHRCGAPDDDWAVGQFEFCRRTKGWRKNALSKIGVPIRTGNVQKAIGGNSRHRGRFGPLST